MIYPLLSHINNITNESVLSYLSGFMSGLQTQVFGADSMGLLIFGIIYIVFFMGLLLFLGASLDLTAAILIPAIALGVSFGWVPQMVGLVTLIGCALIITFAYLTATHR